MEEELIKRILPHSDDAERSVIGCMMMNREAIMIASEILNGDEFYRQQMGIVFDSMVELYNEGKPVDFVTLPEKLKEKDVPPEISSTDFGECGTLCKDRQGKSDASPADQDERRYRQYLLSG